jgi:hypothetical protein
MVSGTLLHVGTKGPEDIFLYGNPKMTFFKNVFVKSRNFVLEYSKIPKSDGSIDLGRTFRIKIPKSGDLLAGIYIDFKLKDLLRTGNAYVGSDAQPDNTMASRYTSYVNGIGFNIIKDIKLYIGGNLIQTLNSELIYIINQQNSEYNRIQVFNNMTKYFESFSIGNTNSKDVKCNLWVPFYFSKNPGQYVPICALNNSEIELEISLRSFEECLVREYNTGGTGAGINGYNPSGGLEGTSGTNMANDSSNPIPAQYTKYIEPVSGGIEYFDIVTQKIFLDGDDQKLFKMCPKLDYLIELYQIGNQEVINNPTDGGEHIFEMISKHPTKYITWVLQREDVYNDNYYDNYTYDFGAKYGDGRPSFYVDHELLEDIDILINNNPLFEGIRPKFLTNIQTYERFKGLSLYPIYLYNFSLSPNSNDPSGTMNMSMYNKKHFRIKLCNNSNFTDQQNKANILFRYYTSYYNILVISDGLAGLIYN